MLGVVALTRVAGVAASEARFPRPDLRSGYTMPVDQVPAPRLPWREAADAGVLTAALGVAAWLVVRRRSRRGIFLLAVFGVAYFGFYRKGCVCPVGSVQNVVQGLADPSQGMAPVVAVFFVLPLVAALLFGRVFCAGVCPLGAIQELFIVRPVRLPRWLDRALGLLPHVYLALAVLFAATGAGYWICRYDPFVGLYRLSGSPLMIATGGALLLLGMVVARPYCRFLCPYGVLLNWCSRLSWQHLTITPDDCIQCRLCEDVCPCDAIRAPSPPPVSPTHARRRVLRLLVTAPLLLLAGAGAGRVAGPALARAHPTVILAGLIRAEEASGIRETEWRTRTFRAGGQSMASLWREERDAVRVMTTGATWAGLFLAAVVVGRLAGLHRRPPGADYVPDRGECVSCGRCFISCPREHARRGWLDGPVGSP